MKMLYVVFKDREECVKITQTLVTEGLVKCVNRLPPIESVYLWEGKLENTQETACFLKLESSKLESTISRIREQHSYKVPAIIEIQVGSVLPEYSAWINS